MADSGTTRETPAEPIGRIRSADDAALVEPEVATGAAEGTGWSPVGIGIAVLLILLMIGAMSIILWASFQTGV